MEIHRLQYPTSKRDGENAWEEEADGKENLCADSVGQDAPTEFAYRVCKVLAARNQTYTINRFKSI